MISAKEAKEISRNNQVEIQRLSEIAYNEVILNIELEIKKESLLGNYQANFSLVPIAKLNETSNEAAKRSVHMVAGRLREKGYSFETFTNFNVSSTIYWDKVYP